MGTRIVVRSTGYELSEREARLHLQDQIRDGERLMHCVERDGPGPRSTRFTFLLWPKAQTHTGKLLQAA